MVLDNILFDDFYCCIRVERREEECIYVSAFRSERNRMLMLLLRDLDGGRFCLDGFEC